MILICAILGRLVCLEMAEEEQKNDKLGEEIKAISAKPGTAGYLRLRSAMKTARRRSLASAKVIESAAKKIHKRKISSKLLNNISLICYFGLTLISCIILIIFIKVQVDDRHFMSGYVHTTPMGEYQHGE